MTLNDNPRVAAERRYKILRHRREWLRRIIHKPGEPKGIDWKLYSFDLNQVLYWSYKARVSRLVYLIEQEMIEVKRILKAFGWKES